MLSSNNVLSHNFIAKTKTKAKAAVICPISVKAEQMMNFSSANSREITQPLPNNQQPISSNVILESNTKAIIDQSCHEFKQVMPLPQYAANSGTDQWSEYKIDSAATVNDLECIRRRLLTLLHRTDTKLKEMRFIMANGKKGFQYRQKQNDLKSKNQYNEPTVLCQSQITACCPFCLNSDDTQDSDHSYTTCEVCDERSNMCLSCREFCSNCDRLTCEDCLMRCDTCTSGVECWDCMGKNAQCSNCIKKTKMNYRNQLGHVKDEHKCTLLAKQGMLADITRQKTHRKAITSKHPKISLHRFIITQTGTLGLTLAEKRKEGTTVVKSVNPGGIGQMVGVKTNDIICIPFTDGKKSFRCCEYTMLLFFNFLDN